MSSRAPSWVVRSIVAAQFGPAFMFSGVAIALPAMGEELQMSAASLGLVETVFMASGAASLLPAGRLADIVPRGLLFRWSLLLFGLLSLALGFVDDGRVVLVLRCLQGMSASLATASTPALLLELVPSDRRGRVFGQMLGAAYVGLALGPLVAGWVIAWFGWRAVFFVGASQILIGGLPALIGVAARWRKPTASLHLPSTALLMLGMAGVVGAVASDGFGAWAFGALATLAIGAFVVWQPRLADPLLDLRAIWSIVELRSALLVQLLLYLNAYASIFLLNLLLQVGKGIEAQTSGFYLATGSVVMACLAPRAGNLSDRLQPQLVAGFGVAFVVISSIAGLWLDASSSVWLICGVLALQGIGFGLFSSPNLALILGSLPKERSGFASAIAAQSRSIGMFTGMVVTSVLIRLRFGSKGVGDDPAGTEVVVQQTYVVLTVTSLIALLAAVRRMRLRSSA